MPQTRLQSLIEALLNVLVGYGINFVANLLILPLFGFNVTLTQNLAIGAIFTAISIVRSYLIRRYFNAKLHNLAERLAR
jgi:hypothetical protein